MRLTTPITYPLSGIEYEVQKMTFSRHRSKLRKHYNSNMCSFIEQDPLVVHLIKHRGSINIL